MQTRLKRIARLANRILAGVATLALAAAVLAYWLYNDRPSLAEVGLLPAERSSVGVTATWLGVSTILFDDGETQILVDAYVSRPPLPDLLLGRGIASHAASVNRAMNDFGMRRLAAIVPGHSHFDHVIDAGAIANRSSASILGSESAAAIARGAGVPEDQIIVAEPGETYSFGAFELRLLPSRHAPVGWGGATPLGGDVARALATPAPVSAFRAGESYTIVVGHADGTTVVQTSAGFEPGALDEVEADVVMLGVAMLKSLGREHAAEYWQALVTSTGAERVFVTHFDDFTRPFGETRLVPKILDNLVVTARWLEEFRTAWDTDTRVFLPVFGEPVSLYPEDMPEA